MKKKAFLLPLLLLLCLAMAACGAETSVGADVDMDAAPEAEENLAPDEEATPELADMQIMTLKGPTGIGMVQMMDQAATDPESNYHFTLAGSPEEIVAGLTGGDIDVAAMPSNLAAKLYAKTEGNIVMLAVTTYGSLYLVEKGESISSVEDLAGRTIYTAGQGSNPQYILEYLLTQAGLTPGEDVFVEYRSEHAEVATLLASGEIDLALLPEPNVTSVLMKDESLRIALDCNQLWQDANGGYLAMSCIAAKRDFVEEHPETVAQFLLDLQSSVSYAQDDVAGAAALCETYQVIPAAAVAEKAIPNCALTFASGEEMEPLVADYFEVLLSADPSSLGGALPGEDFYYTK